MRADVQQYAPFADFFECTILHDAYSKSAAARLEQLEIKKHESCDPALGYNILKGHPVCDKRYWAMLATKTKAGK